MENPPTYQNPLFQLFQISVENRWQQFRIARNLFLELLLLETIFTHGHMNQSLNLQQNLVLMELRTQNRSYMTIRSSSEVQLC